MKRFYFLSLFGILSGSCMGQVPKMQQTESSSPGYEHENPRDTFQNGAQMYLLKVFKRGSECYFTVSKQKGAPFQVILKEPNYGTNQSSLFVADANGDGYWDIVWVKKWETYAYLFNPKIENFVEVGEITSIDTLKKNGKVIYYNSLYPLLYSTHAGHDAGWIHEEHSELFVIDSNFRKLSFATLNNFASFAEENRERCQLSGKEMIHCDVPPYKENKSGFQRGNSIDSFEIQYQLDSLGNKIDSSCLSIVDSVFTESYWRKNYEKVIPYGQFFTTPRTKKLEYFRNGKVLRNPFRKE